MNYDFFSNFLKKIVNFYYNLMSFDANPLKNFTEMPITHEEHKANMVLLKNIAEACAQVSQN